MPYAFTRSLQYLPPKPGRDGEEWDLVRAKEGSILLWTGTQAQKVERKVAGDDQYNMVTEESCTGRYRASILFGE